MVDYSKKKPKIIRDIDGFLKGIEAQIKRTHTFINFPFCVVGPHNVYTSGSEIKKGNIKFDGTSGELEKEKEISKFDRKRKIWDFTPEQIDSIWNIVFNELDEYIVKYQNKEIELAKKVKENEKSVTAEVKKNKNWEKKNPNPIKKIAKECLNLILEHFKLEVETNIDKYPVLSPKENRYIIIKAKCNGEEVGYQYLSTGTKQIMLTATPLFFLQPKNTIVLFDQPETSLYPNIQWLLPKVYIEISPNNNQFHFATHSPVVASAFDPWEVVELEFDNHTGRVLQKPYFEGKKLKESYIINPKLLRWDSNYKKLFGLKFQGNEERIKTLRELSTIDALLRNNKLSKSQREENTKKYFRLAGLLDWQLGEDAKTK